MGDRFRGGSLVDAVRAVALAVVILGHYLIALVHLPAGGDLSIGSLLDQTSWSHPVTWVAQVMGSSPSAG